MGKSSKSSSVASKSRIFLRGNLSKVATVLTGLALLALVQLDARSQTAGPSYAVTDLGTLGGLSAQAFDINEAGHVVGYAASTSGQRGFLWRDGIMTDLGTLGAGASANAINEADQVVGVSGVTGSPVHAVLWENGRITDLTPGVGSNASGINDARQVVGTMNNNVAFVWTNGSLTNLGSFSSFGAFGADINNDGHAVGASYTNIIGGLGPTQHAFVWRNGVMTDLGLLPGDEESGAAAINNSGQIVGSSSFTDPNTYETTSHSFLYAGGVMTALPVPSSESFAGDINDFGVVVGTMRAPGGVSPWHAYVYSNGVVRDLNTLITSGSGLHLAAATALNNAGQIVGWAYDSRGGYHAFLLTPIAPGTPLLNIGDASVSEGNAGTRSLSLTVTLSPASSAPVTVSYGTADATAGAGSDYQAAASTLTFAAGETTKTISVTINGDRTGEPNETFLVNLREPSGAVVADGQGVGTIVDDEPRISAGSVSKNEGNGSASPFMFTISMSPSTDTSITVGYATADGSARAGEDYEARTGSVTFRPGETSKTVVIDVNGDRKSEGNETFYLNLSDAAGAFIAQRQGTGVIRNDDR